MRYFIMLVNESAWEAVKEGWSRPEVVGLDVSVTSTSRYDEFIKDGPKYEKPVFISRAVKGAVGTKNTNL
ncbi:hypothetical protein Goarm_020172 [Gossypium armourianum]|uniref:Uncharacterized protein n=1 Tax=Gossypium armourianum TaxID=34283 RepID=A0A7J9IMT2_9ROSI|nr:hypothetical protein [Gossypium armourianum]